MLKKNDPVTVPGNSSAPAPAVPPLGLKTLFEVRTIPWLWLNAAEGCGAIEGGVSAPLATMPPPTPSRLITPAMIGWRPPNSQSENAPANLKERLIIVLELCVGDATAHLNGGRGKGTQGVAGRDDEHWPQAIALGDAGLRRQVIGAGQRCGPGPAIRAGSIFERDVPSSCSNHVPCRDVDRFAGGRRHELRGGSRRDVDRDRSAGLDDAGQTSASVGGIGRHRHAAGDALHGLRAGCTRAG